MYKIVYSVKKVIKSFIFVDKRSLFLNIIVDRLILNNLYDNHVKWQGSLISIQLTNNMTNDIDNNGNIIFTNEYIINTWCLINRTFADLINYLLKADDNLSLG